VSVVGNHFGEDLVVVVETEFGIIDNSGFAQLEVDGRLMLPSARREMFLPFIRICNTIGIWIILSEHIIID
jgi:hypothetical protein